MAERIYRCVCDLIEAEEITPQNCSRVKSKLSELTYKELAEIADVSVYYVRMCVSLLTAPRPRPDLHALYIAGKASPTGTTTTRGLKLPMKFLELLGIVERVGRMRYRVRTQRMEEFWPNIEKWEKNEGTVVKRRKVSRGKRVEEALEILGVESLEQLTSLSGEEKERMRKKIRELSRIDWKLSGRDIPKRGVSNVKRVLLSWLDGDKA